MDTDVTIFFPGRYDIVIRVAEKSCYVDIWCKYRRGFCEGTGRIRTPVSGDRLEGNWHSSVEAE
jgi:hypothetical protein